MKVGKIKLGLVLPLASVLFWQNSFCQRNIDSTPLVKFLQQNTDTTIIFYYMSPWFLSTDQLIVSKVENRVLNFTYANPYKHYSIMYNLPTGEIGKKLRQEEQLFERAQPDTNRYFLPKDLKSAIRDSAWGEILRHNLWKLKDTISAGIENKYYVSDAGGIGLVLITKGKIRSVGFYDPWDLQEYDPGKIGRKKIIEIAKVFNRVFGLE